MVIQIVFLYFKMLNFQRKGKTLYNILDVSFLKMFLGFYWLYIF